MPWASGSRRASSSRRARELVASTANGRRASAASTRALSPRRDVEPELRDLRAAGCIARDRGAQRLPVDEHRVADGTRDPCRRRRRPRPLICSPPIRRGRRAADAAGELAEPGRHHRRRWRRRPSPAAAGRAPRAGSSRRRRSVERAGARRACDRDATLADPVVEGDADDAHGRPSPERDPGVRAAIVEARRSERDRDEPRRRATPREGARRGRRAAWRRRRRARASGRRRPRCSMVARYETRPGSTASLEVAVPGSTGPRSAGGPVGSRSSRRASSGSSPSPPARAACSRPRPRTRRGR